MYVICLECIYLHAAYIYIHVNLYISTVFLIIYFAYAYATPMYIYIYRDIMYESDIDMCVYIHMPNIYKYKNIRCK